MKITPKEIIDLLLLSKTPSINSVDYEKEIAQINQDLSENGLEIEGYKQIDINKENLFS